MNRAGSYIRGGKARYQNGDIVKVFNERGIVLAGAYVTERLRPGVAYMDHGARHDPIKTGEIERGGAINTITPAAITSENCVGQATSGYLVECAKVTGRKWTSGVGIILKHLRENTIRRPDCGLTPGSGRRRIMKVFAIDYRFATAATAARSPARMNTWPMTGVPTPSPSRTRASSGSA
jgi:hypothetical protein